MTKVARSAILERFAHIQHIYVFKFNKKSIRNNKML